MKHIVSISAFCATALVAYASETCIWRGTNSKEAKEAANWVHNAVPQDGDIVVFDNTSSAAYSWNITIVPGSWTQTADYSGNVTVPVCDSMHFKVNGDITVNGGNLVFECDRTAVGDGSEEVKFGQGYTIEAVNLTVGIGASMNSDGKGFASSNGPGGGSGQYAGGGYGGGGALRNLTTGKGMTYGTAAAPTALGSGGSYSNAGGGGTGGGALKLVVPGMTRIDGRLSVNGGNSAHSTGTGGSGGSIWIVEGTLAGSGTISANCGLSSVAGRHSGGGRIDISS